MTAIKESKLLRVDQVADRLNCNRRNVYYLIDQGKLPALSIGVKTRKGYRVEEAVLDNFIKQRIDEFSIKTGVS